MNDFVPALRAEGLDPSTWSNEPHERYEAHRHAYDKVLVAASGSIVFGLPEVGEKIRLARGDRLDLPAGTLHDATVGPDGVTCLEAHLDRGSLPSTPRHQPGWGLSVETAPRGGA